jgi:hypothetical protein
MPNSHDARVEHERGRNLPGDGISQKCRVGRHSDCAAERCQCKECAHGHSAEIHIELPSGAIARVDTRIQPETLTALDEMMKAIINQVRTEVFEDGEQVKPQRSKPNDEITFAGLTAGLGRRGTGR